jgi:hypothetical protein
MAESPLGHSAIVVLLCGVKRHQEPDVPLAGNRPGFPQPPCPCGRSVPRFSLQFCFRVLVSSGRVDVAPVHRTSHVRRAALQAPIEGLAGTSEIKNCLVRGRRFLSDTQRLLSRKNRVGKTGSVGEKQGKTGSGKNRVEGKTGSEKQGQPGKNRVSLNWVITSPHPSGDESHTRPPPSQGRALTNRAAATVPAQAILVPMTVHLSPHGQELLEAALA